MPELDNPTPAARIARGDYYEFDFPRKGRVQTDAELESQWYVLPAANMTPFLPLEDGPLRTFSRKYCSFISSY